MCINEYWGDEMEVMESHFQGSLKKPYIYIHTYTPTYICDRLVRFEIDLKSVID